jgi:polyhydroxyalkanoate synthase
MTVSAVTKQQDLANSTLSADCASSAGPLSPETLTPALADLLSHIAVNPTYWLQQLKIANSEAKRALNEGESPEIGAEDHRFSDPVWRAPPFNLFARNFQLVESWVEHCARSSPGVSERHADLAAFAARQWLDAFSPSNVPWLNPEVLRASINQGGMNFLRGLQFWSEDVSSNFYHRKGDKEEFKVGRNLATTPGQVVFRNELMELIQYTPTTGKVRPEPILIIPAWIMKYYILDLSPHNSFIRYLVGCGYTVFCISWRNPGSQLAETTFDDYRRLGPIAALDTAINLTGAKACHALGYCLGGTLLAASAAAMARDGGRRLASIALLAAQTDFSEPGELKIFIDETQLDQLDRMMARHGYLESWQMAGAFSMLRARDLIWSRMVKNYLLGEREHTNDLMAWNADATRMPFRMHSEYLRKMFLHNDLAEGRLELGGARVDLAAIATPILAVGTETDHVAPWRSVFKILRLNPGDITFLLASGGHNSGIVSEPGHPHRSFRSLRRFKGQETPGSEDYLSHAARFEGSWWPAYVDWLDALSGPAVAPPPAGASLCSAPGTYVLEH